MNLSTNAIFGVLWILAPTMATTANKPCVGRIVIVGNSHTPDWFIHQLLNLRTGDRLVYPLLRLAERDLAQCGRFSAVDGPTVRPVKANDRGPVVDIQVTVHERPWSELRPVFWDVMRISAVQQYHWHRYLANAIIDVSADWLRNQWRKILNNDVLAP